MYQVNIANRGDYLFKVDSRNYEFDVDMKGLKGITPPDILLASLGTCVGVYLRKYLEGAKLDIGEFDIIVNAEFSKERPICFKQIDVLVDLKGAEIEQQRHDAMIAFMKNCPIHHTLKENPQIDISIK